MSEPDVARDYHQRDVRTAYAVFIQIGLVLGAWREKLVIEPHGQPREIESKIFLEQMILVIGAEVAVAAFSI